MSFNRINTLTGWIVALVACTVYIMTAEAGGSLWDCGEFVSSCFKLQIPHPPGAPLFVIMGRVFILAFGDDPLTAAKAVNAMSALASGFTILFLFWTITHFARRICLKSGEPDTTQTFTIMAAGVVGALAYTFSDSFWYSAVEGEVYALSSFFTALVFWMMLKWEHQADEPGADRWIVLIFFMMGLSIGVHLLNLLTIPAIVMIYYYRRHKVTAWGAFWAFVIGCAITGVVQKVVIQYTIKGAGSFDIFFVNTLGLPFFSGFIFYFLLLTGLVWYGIRLAGGSRFSSLQFGIWISLFAFTVFYAFINSGTFGSVVFKGLLAAAGITAAIYFGTDALRKNPYFLKLSLWCFGFMMIGYSTYVTTLVRSAADPAVDMYNVDNPMSLVGYLGREQYGDFPLIYGQKFTASPIDYEEGEQRYVKGRSQYIPTTKEMKAVYATEDKMLFPRVWDASNDQGHATFYQQWLGLEEGEAPTMADNIRWAFTYQIGWMYLRYFGWNFIGKQNDIQGLGNVRDGNTLTGIGFIDDALLGKQDKLPETLQRNKAHNRLFALPFLLGLIGLFYHYTREKRDFLVSFLLFFFTGMAIVFYLNQAGNQPRERDYAYVGSFYAFAIWIGIGVMQVKEWLQRLLSPSLSNYAAGALCLLAVPVLMASQEWDDHDRSRKVMARDLARNYLESCAPNAILFSFGDNDTYPLWYAQEVEGIRPDVRVINYSLLGIDWYINQLRYKVNESAPIDVIWSADKIEGNKRDYIRFYQKEGITDSKSYLDLYSLMNDFVGRDEPEFLVSMQDGSGINFFPTKKVSVPVDSALVRSNGTVNASDIIVDALRFELPRDVLLKNDMAVLNIIAASKWKRPIYFTSPFGELGFSKYLRLDGMSYRLVPVDEPNSVNEDWAYRTMMKHFAFGGSDRPGTYFDEENRRHLMGIRQAYADVANKLSAVGRKEDARKLLARLDSNMRAENVPYGLACRFNQHDMVSIQLAEAAYNAGDKALGDRISGAVRKDLDQQLAYYAGLGDMTVNELLMQLQAMLSNNETNLNNRQLGLFTEVRQAFALQDYLRRVESAAAPQPAPGKTDTAGKQP